MSDTTEQFYAAMEAARNEAEAKYFDARPQLDRSGPLSTAFRAGFERAFAALWPAPQKPHVSPHDPDR